MSSGQRAALDARFLPRGKLRCGLRDRWIAGSLVQSPKTNGPDDMRMGWDEEGLTAVTRLLTVVRPQFRPLVEARIRRLESYRKGDGR